MRLYQVSYRINGQWIDGMTFATKAEAEADTRKYHHRYHENRIDTVQTATDFPAPNRNQWIEVSK